MDVMRRTWRRKEGWTAPLPRDLDSEQTLVMVFGGPELADAPGPLTELAAAFPRAAIVGCSTAGEIHGDLILDESLSVAITRFERTTVRVAGAPVATPDDSEAAGRQVAAALQGPELRGVFVLSDGLGVNGSALVKGLSGALPAEVVVTGGLAGDGPRFERTWVLHDGAPTQQRVEAVGFYGEHVRIGHGSQGGWDLFGPQRRVTRADGNVLYEIDGEPALALYKKYLGDRAAELPASALLFPLALRTTAADEKTVVRTVLAVDEDAQSMTFAGDIPQGAYVQLMSANFDHLVEGAAEAALHTKDRGDLEDSVSTLSVAISCVGRRLVLGERTEEELEAALEILPEGTEQVGFYSYGEISPFATGHCDLHNQTMTLTTIREARAA